LIFVWSKRRDRIKGGKKSSPRIRRGGGERKTGFSFLRKARPRGGKKAVKVSNSFLKEGSLPSNREREGES